MRIFEMRPEITPWRLGQHRKVASWAFRDEDAGDGCKVRYVWHYATLMLYYSQEPDQDDWTAVPRSVGIGGVSDQNGMNYLLSMRTAWHKGKHEHLRSYGYRYHRAGGARIEAEVTS